MLAAPSEGNEESVVPLLFSSRRSVRHLTEPSPTVFESISHGKPSMPIGGDQEVLTDVPSMDGSPMQHLMTSATSATTCGPRAASARRQTKFTVINYGAADALLSHLSDDENDDDLFGSGVLSISPSSGGFVGPPGGHSTPTSDDVPHHVRFRSSITIADELAASKARVVTAPAGRLRPLTVRHVSVDGGRVQVTKPILPTYPPPPSTLPASTGRHPSSVPGISSLSSVDVVVPSRSSLACCWSGDVSAAERGGAGEVFSSDETGGSRLRSPATSGGHTGRDGDRASRWPLSGQPLVMPSSASSSSTAENGTSARRSPASDVKVRHHVNHVTSTVEISVGNASGGVDDMSKLKEVAKRGRLFAKRCKKRLVYQSGECNLSYINVERRGARFLLDIFTTLLEMKWRYNIIVYLVTFILSWVLFALLWWALHTVHGSDESGVSCVIGVDGFKTAFLFSIETQHTIGYGSRSITDRCPDAMFLLMLQSVFGAVTQCIVTGIIFAKMARPKGRAETIVFSRKAVIHRDIRDGSMCLSFRVADLRNSQLIGVTINALLVRKHRIHGSGTTGDGQHINLLQQRLNISTESGDDFYFLAWPIKLVHRIDESSPLWQLSSEQLLVADFEILVVLEANCEATGATTQVRTSYLPSDILWGHTLAPLFTYQKDNGRFKVDFSQFNNVVAVDTLEMSPKDMAILISSTHNNNAKNSSVLTDEA